LSIYSSRIEIAGAGFINSSFKRYRASGHSSLKYGGMLRFTFLIYAVASIAAACDDLSIIKKEPFNG